MSGYLRRLVERVHGRAEVLRPLVPSRFEPAQDAPQRPSPSLFELHEETAAPPQPTAPPAAPPAGDAKPGSAPSRAALPHDAPQPMLRPVLEPAPQREAPPPALYLHVRESPPARDADEGAALEERVRRAVARALASEEPSGDAAAPPAPLREAPDARRAVEREVPVPGRAVAELSFPVPTPVARPSPAAPPPLPQRREDPASHASPRATAPEHEPAIHVTIGRVEVRAIAPPAPARPGAPRARAGVSLDDYLRGRDRGTS